jgi:hypothetical protein
VSRLTELYDARLRYEHARKALEKAVRRAYPAGATVAVSIGRARVRGPVIGWGEGSYRVGYIGIRNEVTGKERWFYAADRSFGDVAIEAYPECTCKPHQTYHQPPCPRYDRVDHSRQRLPVDEAFPPLGEQSGVEHPK